LSANWLRRPLRSICSSNLDNPFTAHPILKKCANVPTNSPRGGLESFELLYIEARHKRGVVIMIDARLQKELVIRTENRVGLIADISRLLGDMGINFSAVSVEAANSGAVLYLISNSQLYARDALRDAGFQVAEREVVILELPNRPGELCRVTAALARKDIDIEELYATATTGSAKALVVLTCSNNGKAVLMLRGR